MHTNHEPNPFPGTAEVLPELLKDIQDKAESGRVKYGTHLQTHNGRKALVDLYQELLDACFYIKQELMERGDNQSFATHVIDMELYTDVKPRVEDAMSSIDDYDVGPLMNGHRLVHGQRGEKYGHPFEDFGRTADTVNALLGHKFNAPLGPEDIALIMVCVKLSREMNHPQADNLTDAAGYIETWWMIKKVYEHVIKTGEMPDLQQSR